jgi:transcriptional regulator with XRE-family HTH domain
MKRIRKPKPKPDIDPLCAAVRRLRAEARLSQKELAAKLGIAPMTLSRFERGVQVPRDIEVLTRLRDAVGTSQEEDRKRIDMAIISSRFDRTRNWEPCPYTFFRLWPVQWELVQCARVAAAHFPKEADAMRKAAGAVLQLVKEVIGTADFRVSHDENFYHALERRIDDLVKQRLFEQLKDNKR